MVIDKVIIFADEINDDWDEKRINAIRCYDAGHDSIGPEEMDNAGLYRLCDGKQYYPAEIKTTEAERYRRPERIEGSTAANCQCFDQPEPGLPALEGRWRCYCD